MVNNRFELYKIKREIKRSGSTYKFYRPSVNDFGEPTDVIEEFLEVKGLYYEHSAHILDSYVILTGADAAAYRTKKFPQIICLTKDIFDEDGQPLLKVGDICIFNNHMTTVTGVKNEMEWNLVCTISFEEVDYGNIPNVKS